MESANARLGPSRLAEAPLELSGEAAGHLRAALEQMDRLLATQQTDTGLAHLVALLCHLRALRGEAA
jgi:hypothetical protein